MSRYIDAEPLIDKMRLLEDTALSQLKKAKSMEERAFWTGVVDERTAFRYDLIDAPETRMMREWVPCAQRLPGDFIPVNVTWIIEDLGFSHIGRCVGTAIRGNGKWWWYTSGCEGYLKQFGSLPEEIDYTVTILAWMPLPEEYTGEI